RPRRPGDRGGRRGAAREHRPVAADRLARGRLLRLHHGGARPRLRHPRAQCRLPRRRLHDLPGRRRPRYRTHPGFPRRGDHRLHLAPARLRLRNLLTHPSNHPSEPPPLQPPTPPTTHPSNHPPLRASARWVPTRFGSPLGSGPCLWGFPLLRIPPPGGPALPGPCPWGPRFPGPSPLRIPVPSSPRPPRVPVPEIVVPYSAGTLRVVPVRRQPVRCREFPGVSRPLLWSGRDRRRTRG